MKQCYKSGDFYKYFEENMNALGLSAPKSLFESVEKATATATTILSTLSHLGRTATIGEIIGATASLEKLAVVGAISASAYVGAVIGSIAVASGRSLACGTSIADVLWMMKKNNLDFPHAHVFYKTNPEILDKTEKNRVKFRAKCKQLNQYGYICQ
ncbi:hypothetical protein [Photobacterium kagoshimensis]|uniref:hypothetical protein n=1 Tax=Photobacterium kagoshimensis TaxID=2910242 RepID=UPI003D0DC8FA